MAGDYSRNTFDPAKHFAGVLMQQGRVQVDADANEQLAIARHRVETETIDVVGMTGPPKKNSGFGVGIASTGNDLTLSRGRFYVEGILCENDAFESFVVQATANSSTVTVPHLILDGRPIAADQWMHVAVNGAAPQVLQVQSVDPATRHVTFTANVTNGGTARMARVTTFLTQPDVIAPAIPTSDGTYLVYLDVWEREISALDDPSIREVALGGPDTARRTKIVWQVRFLQLDSGSDCSTGAARLRQEKRPSTGMLTASTTTPPDDENPCLLPPTEGYRGLENQLYRVEIHRGGELPPPAGQDPPAFKWSRDNGSVEVTITNASGSKVTVNSLGKDDVLDFKPLQWTEIIDEQTLLDGVRNPLTQIDDIDDTRLEIEMKSAVPVGSTAQGLKLRRWDQRDAVTANGVVATAGATRLEAGIEVRFSDGFYQTGDYWLIPARTATQQILWPGIESGRPEPQLPLGIRHRYAPLAVVELGNGTFSNVVDCRKPFPALTDICAEDVCFDNTNCKFPSHIDNVQEAIDELCARTDLRLHNKYLHGWGVVCGLQVYCAGDRTVLVKEGYALDCEGYDIFLREDRELDLATLEGSEHLEGKSVCLSIERNGNGEPRFRLHPNPEVKDDWEKILDGTLLFDFYEDCLKKVYDELQKIFDPRDKEPDRVTDGQRRVSALTSLFIQWQNPKNGQNVYLSRRNRFNDHETLQEIYEAIRKIVEASKTSCRLTENLRPLADYPEQIDHLRTIYAKGFRERVRTHPRDPLVYAFGTDHTIDLYDGESGEMMRRLEFPIKEAIVDDVAVQGDGNRLYAVAFVEGKESFYAETNALDGKTWSTPIPLGSRVPTIVTPRTFNQRRAYALALGPNGGILEIDVDKPSVQLLTPFKDFLVGDAKVNLQPVRHLVLAEVGGSGFLFATAGLPATAAGKYAGVVRQALSRRSTRAGATYIDFEEQIGEDDIAASIIEIPGGDGQLMGDLFAILDPSSSSTTKRILNVDAVDGRVRQSFDLGENTTFRLDTVGELTAVVTYEGSYRMDFVSNNGLFEEHIPLQVCPRSVAVSRETNVAYAYNQTSNTITAVPLNLIREHPVDLTLLREYRRKMLEAFIDLFVALLQSIKDCFCEHLLIDCPTCTEADRVYLGCIELDEGIVDRICNLEKRHYVHTFRSVEYWLSIIPVQRIARWAIERFCCLDLKLNVKIPDDSQPDRYECGTAMSFSNLFRDAPKLARQAMNRVRTSGRVFGDAVTSYRTPAKKRVEPKELIGQPVQDVLPQLEKAGIVVKRVEEIDSFSPITHTVRAATVLRENEPVVIVERKGKVAYFRTGVSEDAGAVKIQQRDIDGLRAELTAATEPLSQKIESIAAERDDALARAGALDSELTKLRQVVAKLESANTAATKRIEKLTVTTEKLGKGVAEIKELKKEITKLQKLIRPPG